jgi:hypothetical protein
VDLRVPLIERVLCVLLVASGHLDRSAAVTQQRSERINLLRRADGRPQDANRTEIPKQLAIGGVRSSSGNTPSSLTRSCGWKSAPAGKGPNLVRRRHRFEAIERRCGVENKNQARYEPTIDNNNPGDCAWSLFDLTHAMKFSYVYRLPMGRRPPAELAARSIRAAFRPGRPPAPSTASPAKASAVYSGRGTFNHWSNVESDQGAPP